MWDCYVVCSSRALLYCYFYEHYHLIPSTVNGVNSINLFVNIINTLFLTSTRIVLNKCDVMLVFHIVVALLTSTYGFPYNS